MSSLVQGSRVCVRFSLSDESTEATLPCPSVAYKEVVHTELHSEAKFSVDSAVDNLSNFPGFPTHGGSRERQWGATEPETGSRGCRAANDFPKTRPATSREIPLAAEREGMGSAWSRAGHKSALEPSE